MSNGLFRGLLLPALLLNDPIFFRIATSWAISFLASGVQLFEEGVPFRIALYSLNKSELCNQRATLSFRILFVLSAKTV